MRHPLLGMQPLQWSRLNDPVNVRDRQGTTLHKTTRMLAVMG